MADVLEDRQASDDCLTDRNRDRDCAKVLPPRT
jgi:hypothetical protein